MKTLIIAEKPSVASDIAAALGGCTKTAFGFERADLVISAAAGHLAHVDAPGADSTGKSLDTLPIIPQRFNVKVYDEDRTKQRYLMLKKLMERADVATVVNACDAGREGELIFRLIYEAAGCRKPTKRMWLQSMTQAAIRDGFAQMRPGSEFDRLADAARCRTESDWLVGINGTRGVSLLHKATSGAYRNMSVGRVQTPTLAILVDLENKIRNFRASDYFEVHGTFNVASGSYVGKWFSPAANRSAEDGDGYRILKREAAEAILAKCRGVTPSSVKDETTPASEAAPLMFDLTSLQREANKKYGFTAADTLKIAQALYEQHKVTTYPRTDASALPEDYIETAKQTLCTFAGTPYAPFASRAVESGWVRPNKRIFNNEKISDHFAIIPTGVAPRGLSDAEQKIYDMVVRRFIAAFYPSAEYLQTTRTTMVAGEQFRSTGRVTKSEGWRAVYGTSSDESGQNPPLAAIAPGEQVAPGEMAVKALKTKPPARLTEAKLLSAMEHAGKLVDDADLSEAMSGRGLGTPATRAAIIENLLSTKGSGGKPKEPYLTRQGKSLVPTELGMDLIHFLRTNNIGALTSPAMTGEWEHKLEMMCKGQYTRDVFMGEIGKVTHEIIDALCARAPQPAPADIPAPCPKCGSSMRGGVSEYLCSKQCGVKVPRTLLGRAITPQECAQLLRDRKSQLLTGFWSVRSKKSFEAILVLNDAWEVKFDFPSRDSADPAAMAAAPLLKEKCPKCGGGIRATPNLFACEKADFSFPRTKASRTMSNEEADYLIKHRTTPQCSGFISTKNKAFIAAYELTEDLEVKFVFS